MKNYLKILLSLSAFAYLNLHCEALEVVYPKNLKVNVAAGSTFFVGSTEPDAALTINKKPVKVWENGSFVEVVSLAEGENTFIIESQKGESMESKTYSINKTPKSQTLKEEAPLEAFPENQFIYAMVLDNNTPLRERPDENGTRITHLGKDTILMINGKKGRYFRVYLTPEKTAWVDESKVVNCSTVNEPLLANITNVSITDDKNYDYIKSNVSLKVPYKIKEMPQGFELELFHIKENALDNKLFKPQGTVKNLAIATTETGRVSKYFIELDHKIWGYDAYYEGATLVLKIRKAPKIDETAPLKGIIIGVDAGHGGADSGSVGPTGVKEKELNLDVANKLKKELEAAGAQVVMTRCDDTNVPLYDRPEIAKKCDALILVSIHANALPDGGDPYKKHGTSAFYYNDESKALAQTLKTQLVTDLGTQDDGLSRTSFVLTRPTMPLCTLVEVAYMIHPSEYMLMLDETFRQKAAVSLRKGLENYLLQK